MNFKKTMIAIAAQFLLVGGAYAQNCVANAGSLTDASGTVNFDTCTSTNQLASICNGLTPIGNTTDTVFQVQIGATATGNIRVTPTGYDAYVALLQGTCTGGSTCLREEDNAASGGAETVSAVGLAAGTYFMLITSFSASAPNCGPTAILVTPTLPVTLQNFSVN